VQVLDDPAAARMLLDDEHRRYLLPFLGTEHGTAEVAGLLGESVERTAYRVRTLAARGLLRATSERTRAGRAVQVYRAAAELRAPVTALPMADVTRLFELVDRTGRDAFLAGLSRLAVEAGLFDWSLRFRAEQGSPRFDLYSPTLADRDPTGADAPAVVFNWVPLAVDAATAKRLQRRLLEVVADQPVATARPTHLLGVFLAPLGG